MNAKERLESLADYKSAFEELTASNAALFSANSELRSANEKMRGSLERLSVQIEELGLSHADLGKMIEATKAPVILLDRDLAICAYTAAACEIFELSPADRKRPLTDLAHHLSYQNLASDLLAVLHTGESRTRRAALANGRTHYLLTIRPIKSGDAGVQNVVLLFAEITGMVRADEQKDVLIAELNHRVKNMLAVIIAIARQTVRRAPTANAFYEAFTARLHAMARTYELLSRESWSEVNLGTLVQQELNPYASDGPARTSFGGPHVMLKPKMALSLGLIFHELATNAAKYGALSTAAGTVAVTWKRQERQAQKLCLMLEWLERHGPPVAVPEKSGFGIGLVCNEAKYSLRGKATIKFETEGLVVDIEIPLGSGS
jgi:two-component system CheB/CheR fusion protein